MLAGAGQVQVPVRSTMRLLPGIEGGGRIVWVGRDVTTERAVYERLHKRIFEDELTGLPHRSIFLDRLDLSLRRDPNGDEHVGLLFVGLDRFTDKNDRYGRDLGDELLRRIANRLDEHRSDAGIVARWGGDEFVILFDAVDPASIADSAAAVLDAVRMPIRCLGSEVFLTASVGLVTARPGDNSTDEVLRYAEAACRLARQRGGDRFQRFDETMRAQAIRRGAIEDGLHGAAERGELTALFQPEVALDSERIVGVETLLRWRHPRWGPVGPADFIPVAEASNLILELGQWVMHEAMRQCARWRAGLGDTPFFVAVNISAREWGHDDFVERVARALAATGADPADVCLEITESALLEDLETATATLRRLKALGLRLAVDDFGTGYSSLSYLRRFPIDVLKVDQSFVAGLGHDPEDSAIVEAVVSMGRALGLTTVAEGVETAHQVLALRDLGCDIAQGYHYARPESAERVSMLLGAGRAWRAVD